jgi:predicted RNA-binding protein YlxR (DUF448 family)
VPFLNDVKQKALGFVSTNSGALLTAGGVVGTVATAVLTGRACYKANDILREANAKKKEDFAREEQAAIVDVPKDMLTKLEKIVAVGPHFIPPIIVGGATIASIVMANRMSAQKAAALAAAYGLAERNLSEYKEKVAEKLTGPKAQQIDDELAQDRVNKTGGYQNIVMVEGEVLCFDEPTARYFRSTMENIKSAVNATNAEILNHDMASAGFFYEELGLQGTSWTDDIGWNRDSLVDLKYSTVLSPDGRPCIAIDFKVPPRADYIPKHY